MAYYDVSCDGSIPVGITADSAEEAKEAFIAEVEAMEGYRPDPRAVEVHE